MLVWVSLLLTPCETEDNDDDDDSLGARMAAAETMLRARVVAIFAISLRVRARVSICTSAARGLPKNTSLLHSLVGVTVVQTTVKLAKTFDN